MFDGDDGEATVAALFFGGGGNCSQIVASNTVPDNCAAPVLVFGGGSDHQCSKQTISGNILLHRTQ